jgi:adenosylcobinamide-GDP ribazoletransferase
MGAGLFVVLFHWKVSPGLRGVMMALFYLAVTGGLHMDGLMDMCDAVFSRQDRETRLRILSDPHVGAFGVMGCVAVLLLKAGIFSDLFLRLWETDVSVVLALLPIYSRIGVGILLYLPFARKEGLAKMLGAHRVSRDSFLLVAVYVFSSVFLLLFLGVRGFAVPLAGGAFLLFHALCCVKIFGGITGDLLGAFVELSETWMLLAFLVAGG